MTNKIRKKFLDYLELNSIYLDNISDKSRINFLIKLKKIIITFVPIGDIVDMILKYNTNIFIDITKNNKMEYYYELTIDFNGLFSYNNYIYRNIAFDFGNGKFFGVNIESFQSINDELYYIKNDGVDKKLLFAIINEFTILIKNCRQKNIIVQYGGKREYFIISKTENPLIKDNLIPYKILALIEKKCETYLNKNNKYYYYCVDGIAPNYKCYIGWMNEKIFNMLSAYTDICDKIDSKFKIYFRHQKFE